MNLKYNKKFQTLSWWYFETILQILSKANRNDMDMKSKKNLRNKQMFRYTSGIGWILLESHLKFLPIQSSSNVVQINNQNVGKAQI